MPNSWQIRTFQMLENNELSERSEIKIKKKAIMTRVRPKNSCKDPMKMIVLVPLQKHSIDCLIESQTQGFRALFAKQASISVTPKWKTGGWF